MTKRKKIIDLIKNVRNKKINHDELKSFISEVVEIMAESGISPSIRREFMEYSREPVPDAGKIIAAAEDCMGLILEKN